jgi:hypothetical protein
MLLAETMTFDLGPKAIALLTPLIGVVVLIVQNHFSRKNAKEAATKADVAASQLQPNGGTSMRDAMDRTEKNSKQTLKELRKLSRRVAVLEAARKSLPPPPPPPPVA